MKKLLLLITWLFTIQCITAQNTWVQKTNFGGVARYAAVGFSIGTKGYIGTGDDGSSGYKKDFWEYDPSTNTWTQKTDFGGTARVYAVGFSIGTKGYIGSGFDINSSYTKDFWEYDPSANTWAQKTDFGGTARYAAVGFSIGSKGYIGTGYDGSFKKDFWEYDPSANTWIQKTDFGGTARYFAVGFSIGTKGYLGTGNDNTIKKDFWEFDPSANTWAQKTDFGGTARQAAVGFGIGTKGYIGTGYVVAFWEYNPSTNTWTQKTDFGGTGRQAAVGFSIGTKGYIGTGDDGSSLKKDFWEYAPAVIPLALVVTNTNDAGPGSLRQAILDANTDPDANTITFQSGVTGTITLLSALPPIAAPLTVTGPGASMLTISGNNSVVVLELFGNYLNLNSITIADGKSLFVNGSGVHIYSGTLIVNNCTFSNNNADRVVGGAIFSGGNLTITNSTFINNSSVSGGAIYGGGGVNTITNCTFTNNRAKSAGTIDAAGGTWNITGCTFNGNSATDGYSGAIYNRNSATITNSTFTGNSAAGSGGAFFNNGSQLIVTNCTITNNTGGAIANGPNGPLTLINTIIAGNPGINMNNYGPITDGGNNIKDDASGPATITQVTLAELALGPLADNGGPTKTIALLPGSAAINTGSCVLATDQRGISRTEPCDIGAFEFVQLGPTASVLSVNGSSTICRGTAANLVVTITGGSSPCTVVYSDGTTNFTVNSYTSGADILVSPTANTTYSLVSVTDAGSNAGTGNSGTPTITVTDPPTWYLDADGDTYYVSSVSSCTSPGAGYNTTGGTLGDCNDANAAVYVTGNFYVDADGDTYGTGTLQPVCYNGTGTPAGYSTNNTDCNDGDVAVNSLQTYFRDADGDSYGSSTTSRVCSATAPAGFVTRTGDCNDNNASINPGAAEVCGNGIDDNCNGSVDEQPCFVCGVVTSLTTTNITSGSAQLNWTANANAVQWQVRYKITNLGSKWVDVLLGGHLRTVTISSLLANQTYIWQIRAKCGNTWTGYSGSVQFKTLPLNASFVTNSWESKQPLPLYEMQKELTVQNYPNPFSSVTTIRYQLPTAAQVSVVVYNQYGQSVAVLANGKQTAGTHQVIFNAGKLSAGLYNYQLQTIDANGKLQSFIGKMIMMK